MADGIIYSKGVVPRGEDFRAAQKMRGEIYNYLKDTLEETMESAFKAAGYTQKASPAGFYGDGSAYGFGVDEGKYNVKVGSKTDSYLEKRVGLGGKRIVCELHMTMYPESMTVEMHYKNTEDASFRGFQEGTGGYMVNEKMVMNCANMEKFKEEVKKKFVEFAEKEVGYITLTKLGNEDRMDKSTASVVENKLSLSNLLSGDFDEVNNKIQEAAWPKLYDEKKHEEDHETDDLLLGDVASDEERRLAELQKYVGEAGIQAIQHFIMKQDADETPIISNAENYSEIAHLADKYDHILTLAVDEDELTDDEIHELQTFGLQMKKLVQIDEEISAVNFNDKEIKRDRLLSLEKYIGDLGVQAIGHFILGWDKESSSDIINSPNYTDISQVCLDNENLIQLALQENNLNEDEIDRLQLLAQEIKELVENGIQNEITTSGAGAGGAGGFGYDVPLGAPRKRKLSTSAPFDQPVNESKKDSSLESIKKKAQKISKEEGIAQHVNKTSKGYTISDWYDSDNTVASYENGRSLNESSSTKEYSAELHHDGGVKKIKTTASSKQAALDKLCKAENCPKSAIKNLKECGSSKMVKESLNQKGISKVKSMLETQEARVVAKKLIDFHIGRILPGMSSSDLPDTVVFADGLDSTQESLEAGNIDEAFEIARDTAQEMLEDEGGFGGLFEGSSDDFLASKKAEAIKGYMTSALWTLPEEEPAHSDYHNFDHYGEGAADDAKKAVSTFLNLANEEDVVAYLKEKDAFNLGHDLWLTRNGHGVGFWDRGMGEVGDNLTDVCKKMGEQYAYTGDDGKVYFMGGDRLAEDVEAGTDLFSKIRKEFGPAPEGADLRDVNGQAYVYYYGPNDKATAWANKIKDKYPKGVVFTDTSKMNEEEESNAKDDLIDYTIPSWAMSALINGDESGLSDAEQEKLHKFVDSVVEKFGNAHFIIGDIDGEDDLGFCHRNDIDGLMGDDCYRLYIKPDNKSELEENNAESHFDEFRYAVRNADSVNDIIDIFVKKGNEKPEYLKRFFNKNFRNKIDKVKAWAEKEINKMENNYFTRFEENTETMNEQQRKFENTPYAKRLRENAMRPTNHTRIIPEGDGFWQVVDQKTLDSYKKNHIMGAPGAEGVEVNSKEEEEYNSGGHQKFPGGKAYKKDQKKSKKKVDEGFQTKEYKLQRERQKYNAVSYLKKAKDPVVVEKNPHSNTLVVFEDANPQVAKEKGYDLMETSDVLNKIENEGYHAMLVSHHRMQQDTIAESVKKRWKREYAPTQTEINERWKTLSTINEGETIRKAESVIPDQKEKPQPKKRLSESVEGLNQLTRDNALEEGDVIDGRVVVEVEKPNCLAPVYYKVFKEDYENTNRAFLWDFNTGMLVNNPNYGAK